MSLDLYHPVHHSYMQLALQQAEYGLYTTHPNPRVGCVLVKDRKIIGKGHHHRAGQPHAEIMALRSLSGTQHAAESATLYVTLEPCCHHGRTPPCTEAIIQAGIKTVYVAAPDPNPAVHMQGIARLQQAGITVHTGLMADQARQLNVGYYYRYQNQLPWTRLKLGISMDGRTSSVQQSIQNKDRWITGLAARKDVQHWRAMSSAIITGINTVVTDNPQLNLRHLAPASHAVPDQSRQPDLFIVDNGYLSIPQEARIFTAKRKVYLVTQTRYLSRKNNRTLSDKLELLTMPCQAGTGYTDLHPLGRYMAEIGINELLVEAGQGLSSAYLRSGLVNQVIIYQAPILLGDQERGMLKPGDHIRLKILSTMQLEQDIRHIATIEAMQ